MAGIAPAAAHWLEIAVDHGFANWPYLATHSPGFTALSGEPALQPVMQRLKKEMAGVFCPLNSSFTPSRRQACHNFLRLHRVRHHQSDALCVDRYSCTSW